MKSQLKTSYIPWRDRAFLSLAEAAEITARSPGWVRRRIGSGMLIGHRIKQGAPLVVSVSSLIAYVAAVEPVAPGNVKAPPTRLTVVASNSIK